MLADSLYVEHDEPDLVSVAVMDHETVSTVSVCPDGETVRDFVLPADMVNVPDVGEHDQNVQQSVEHPPQQQPVVMIPALTDKSPESGSAGRTTPLRSVQR